MWLQGKYYGELERTEEEAILAFFIPVFTLND
jgi:hypothetical protein